MKQKGWKRRVLPVLLAVAMVLGSMDMTSFVIQAAENAYEATSGTHGATYDSESNQVTFYVKNTDAFYSQVSSMWYKEYTTYEEAAAAHVSAGGNFIDGTGAVNVTENGDEKTYTAEVTEGTGAILYYFNAGAGHDRTQYEHIIIIDDSASGSSTGSGEESSEQGGSGTTSSEYVNLEEKSTADEVVWWTNTDATTEYNEASVTVAATNWGQQDWWSIQWAVSALDVTQGDWVVEYDIISTIDKTVYSKLTTFGGEDDDAPIIESTYDLTANVSKHYSDTATISADGQVRVFFNLAGGTGDGSVTISNVKLTKVETLDAPALNTDKLSKDDGYTVGQDVELTFTDDSVWRSAVTAVKVNNATIAAGNYTLEEGTLTLDSSAFARQNVYTVAVEAEGYDTVSFTLPVYDAGVASEDWELEWSDEFTGSELDTTKWSYEIGIQSGEDGNSSSPVYWGNNEKQYYTKEAVTVENGYLVITGNKLTDEVKQQYNVTDNFVEYTSGRIRTVTDDGDTLFATTYGRIEAKMSLPGYQGYWPAFWMLPATDYYGTWASSGELDIMEAVGQNPGYVNGTIHYGGQWPNNINSGGTYTFPEGSDINTEHVYAVEWEPGEIRWYVDDVLYHVETNWYGMDANGERYTYPAPYDEDFYILFNLAMSGNYVSNVLPEDDEMGKQMKVDYVRVYKDANTDYDAVVTAPETERDTASFEEYGEYVDLIKDKDYGTLSDNAYGDGANVLPGNELWWSAVNTGAGAAATVSVDDGAAKINVTTVGSNDYNVQLIQNIPLAKGYTYRVTFDAWTDVTTGRTIRVAPGGDCNHGWKSYDAGLSPTLTTTKKTYSFDFTMNSDSDPSVRLEFNIGGALGTVFIDNVSVIALTDEELAASDEDGAKEPLASGEHIYNGTFDKGNGKLGYWTAEGTQGSTDNRNYTVTVGSDGAKLTQTGLQLRAEDEYELTFDASTLSAGKVRMTLTDENGATVYATQDYTLATGTESYSLEFTVPEGSGTDMGKLVIEFIGTGETVTVDNVSLMRLTNVQMEWDAYEFYPIKEGDTSGWTKNDEVVTWTYNVPVSATDIGNGETGFAVETQPGSFNYSLMLMRNGVSLSNGLTYRIKYAVKATAENQPIEVKIEDNSFSPCYDENLTVGTEWTYVDTTFTSTLGAAGDLKFCLAGVDQKCTVYVKDVCIELEGVPVPQFAADSEISEMKVGESDQLHIEYNIKVQDKYNSFTYGTSDTKIVAVATDGTITAKAAGKATITVTSMLGTSFSFDVTVTEADSGEEETPHTHTGGTATCVSPAICEICKEPYGSVDENNHTGGTEVRNRVEATATTNGYTGDTYCKGCGAKLATGTTIPATGSGDGGNTGDSGNTGNTGDGGNTGDTGNTGDSGNAPVQDGWYEQDGLKYWYENGVKQGTEGRGKEIWDPVSDAWYWLDAPNGVMAKSKDVYQESLAGDWGDYFNKNGERCGKWVRYDENGRMVKGWDTTDAGTYFFDYQFGTMAKGFATIEGKEYYFNPTTGVLEYEIGEVPEFGWKTIDGKDYWYENYIRQGYSVDASYRGKEIHDPGTDAWYWLDNIQGGAKAVSKDVYQESLAGDWGDYTNENGERCGKWVRYDENGHMVKGWQTTDTGSWFFDYTYGTMAKGWATIDGTSCYFNEETGILQ